VSAKTLSEPCGVLVKQLWGGAYKELSPNKLKVAVGMCHPQFAGCVNAVRATAPTATRIARLTVHCCREVCIVPGRSAAFASTPATTAITTRFVPLALV
jgi:hypothetical protein